MPLRLNTAPTNRLPLSGGVNWSAPCAGSITRVRVRVILLPFWSVTEYTVPTGPDRLFDGDGAALVLTGELVDGGADPDALSLRQAGTPSIATATAARVIFIDLPPRLVALFPKMGSCGIPGAPRAKVPGSSPERPGVLARPWRRCAAL